MAIESRLDKQELRKHIPKLEHSVFSVTVYAIAMGSRGIYKRRQRIQLAVGIILVILIAAVLLIATMYQPG